MANLIISGETNPEIGKDIFYSIFPVGLDKTIANPLSPISTQPAHWEIYVLEKRKWRKTTQNVKTGDTVSYNFNQKSLVREGIKLVVTRGNDKGELHIKTKRAGKPKVKKVELFDRNYHKISKPLNYTDTIIAKAYCDEMEGETVLFTLWEDDAVGSGHNKINEMNKINPIPLRKDVVDGVAEVRFNMALYTQAARIADMQVAKGDKNEGKNHEYYVTVDYYGKMVGESKNVNIQNPNYDNPIQRALELQYPEKFPPKPKEPNKRPTPSPEKPKKDAFKAPITAKAKTKAPDPKGKILSAEFVDGNQKPFANMKFGTSVYAKVRTNGLKGKTVIIKIFEDDLGTNQRVYMESHTLPGDVSLIPIKLSQKMRADGDNLTEGNEQEYFLQIEYAGQSVTSSLVNVNDDAPRIKMETGASTVGVKKQESKKASTCLCQEYDLIWGNKVSCRFRKKVVEICMDLWPQNYMEMANNLMACMAWETGASFSPSAKNPNSSATGLIQFMESTAQDELGTTTYELSKMTAVEQLDYVKKYFENTRNKHYEFIDLYLRIIYPASMGEPDSHVVFSKDGKGLNKNDKHYRGRIISYGVNSGFDTNPEYGNNDGMVTKGEMKKGIQIYIERGKTHKTKKFNCQTNIPSKPINISQEKGTWNVVITEQYTGLACTHIERTPIRNNCRRGKIEIYDHNKKIILTINDCLLEGIKGEDRLKTGADVPYGTYQINKTTPFYSSTSKNKKSYGPHPRLVFEPIKGNGDDADKSGRSAIRIHGGRQEGNSKVLKRTEGCIRIHDDDAKKFYDWWVSFNKKNPNVNPGKVIIKK